MDDSSLTRELIDQGYRALAGSDFHRAAEFGRRIADLGHPAGYEFQALDHASRGCYGDAVGILEQGLGRLPGTWYLWDLLGIYRTEQGDYGGAHEAFDEALFCPEPSEVDVHIHAADALRAEGRPEAALARLEFAQPGGPTYLRALAIRVGLLNDLERSEAAAAFASEVVDELRSQPEPRVQWERISQAEVYAGLALALWRGDLGPEPVLEHAWRAIALDPSNQIALRLIRRLTGEPSRRARYMRLKVRRRVLSSPAARFPGATYEVVAESPEEAVEYLRPFEPSEARASIEIEDCAELGEAPEEPRGVLAVWTALPAPLP